MSLIAPKPGHRHDWKARVTDVKWTGYYAMPCDKCGTSVAEGIRLSYDSPLGWYDRYVCEPCFKVITVGRRFGVFGEERP